MVLGLILIYINLSQFNFIFFKIQIAFLVWILTNDTQFWLQAKVIKLIIVFSSYYFL